MYKEFLKKFNLSIGEEFEYDYSHYKVSEDGIYLKTTIPSYFWNNNGPLFEYKYELATDLITNMLIGKIKTVKKWKPRTHEIYYTPLVSILNFFNCNNTECDDNSYVKIEWGQNKQLDNYLFDNDLVFKAEKLR